MLLFIVLAHTQKLKGANFNTSHVTVYRGATITRTQSGKYFNTSHVTVYRIPDTDEAFEMVFQYISCYCLSNSIQPLKSLFVKFQYISCYCLSDLQIFLLHCLRNFNTSHVTVYRFPPGFTISVNRYFNTSHVTVYLCLGSDRKRNIRYFNTSHVTVYQRFGRPFRSRYLISIHLMLLFIFFSAFTAKFKNAISIHLMLLFIATVSNASLIPC